MAGTAASAVMIRVTALLVLAECALRATAFSVDGGRSSSSCSLAKQTRRERSQSALLRRMASTSLLSSIDRISLPAVELTSVLRRQTAIYDGAEWTSIQHALQRENKLGVPTQLGQLQLVVGTVHDDTVVGIAASNTAGQIYRDSMAVLPSKNGPSRDATKWDDYLATYTLAMANVHCVLPRLDSVAGTDSDTASFTIPDSRVVVVGGSKVAQFAANGLAAMGANVHLVSTASSDNLAKNLDPNVDILPPSIDTDIDFDRNSHDDNDDDGEENIDTTVGFSQSIGTFDALLDTIDDERGPVNFKSPTPLQDHLSSTVTNLLRDIHQCQLYVSTKTKSQRLISQEGVLWGPGKAKQYIKSLASSVQATTASSVPPLAGIGNTVQTLFDRNILITAKQASLTKIGNEGSLVRGWTLPDFWEDTTWPRDTTGAGTTRYGLPVQPSEIDLVDDTAPVELTQPPSPASPFAFEKTSVSELLKKDSAADRDKHAGSANIDTTNPYVEQIDGVEGLRTNVVERNRDCVLFLSARFCKTCKTLMPQYTRMAKLSDLDFVKAEASGPVGKRLGNLLDVRAVPAFLFFRNGKRFGSTLSLSRLPSSTMNRALELLQSGNEWDPEYVYQDDDCEQDNSKRSLL